MAKYRLLYAIVYFGSLAFALAYESKLTFVLFVGAAVLPVVTLILLVLSGLLLKLEVIPDTEYVGKLQNFDITIRVKNRFIIPVSPMMITGTFHDRDGSIIPGRRLVLSAGALRKSDCVFSGSIRYRGRYRLGIESAVIYDLLRIFKFKIKNTPGCIVTVTPRRIILDETSALWADDYESSLTKVSFMDSSTSSSVRKYEDGDLLKHVHWKLSAKQDELMVRQMEQNLGSSAVIVTDMHALTENTEENMKYADAAAETALAITRKIITDGRSALNIYRTRKGSAGTSQIQNIDEYEQLLDIFAVLPITDTVSGAEALVPKAAELMTGCEPLFIITPKLEAQTFSAILASVSGSCSEMRIYLTGSKPSPALMAEADASRIASVSFIDPDDIALSLRESMSR